MKITISPRAKKQLKKLSKIDQISIAQKIRSIRNQKELKQQEKLKGFKNVFRIRIGNYRIVYKKNKQELYIILIGHSKDIYKLLIRLMH